MICPGAGAYAHRRPHFLDVIEGTNEVIKTGYGVAHCVSSECRGAIYFNRAPRSDDWGPIVKEVVEPLELLGAYQIGGFTAAMELWDRPAWKHRRDDFKPVEVLDFLFLTGQIPRRFRLSDGSADAYHLPRLGGMWMREMFGPLEWPKIDLDNLTRDTRPPGF